MKYFLNMKNYNILKIFCIVFRNIISSGSQLALTLEERNKLCYKQETEKLKFDNKNCEAVELLVGVDKKKDEIEDM